jgi:hypothetical protein
LCRGLSAKKKSVAAREDAQRDSSNRAISFVGRLAETEINIKPLKNGIFRATGCATVRILKRNRTRGCGTVRVCIPQQPLPFGLPRKRHYNTKEVAKVLGITSDLLGWRIKAGKYPDPPRGNAGRRLFEIEDVIRLEARHCDGRSRSV